jgi:hypothetical protein
MAARMHHNDPAAMTVVHMRPAMRPIGSAGLRAVRAGPLCMSSMRPTGIVARIRRASAGLDRTHTGERRYKARQERQKHENRFQL